MALEIKVPSPGESITEVEMTTWFVENGTVVRKNQEVGEIESDKATLPLIAEKPGRIEILVKEGETVAVGTVVATIDTSVAAPEPEKETPQAEKKTPSEEKKTTPADTPEQRPPADPQPADSGKKAVSEKVRMTPVAREMMEKEGLSVEDILNGLRKITASDVKEVLNPTASRTFGGSDQEPTREEERKKISQLRKKISQRLVAVKNETAMLTTFNEADMSAIMELRKRYQEKFVEAHGMKLGFMSFFTKAVTEALKRFPAVNSYMEEESVVVPSYCDIGIAVQTDKGLMVPVIRNAEALSLAAIEKRIADLAGRARKARLSIEEMSGGTFTISNGGIYGSMLSTPILNPPQSGILGMHNIVERPVALNGTVVIRPMMYLALSYDHRVIDGKDSVGFLKAVKEYIEDPVKLLFGAGTAEEMLLGL